MGSLAAYKTAYLNSTVLSQGGKMQLAGPVSKIDQFVAEGATVAQAVARLNVKGTRRKLYKAQYSASPEQATLVSDFYALDAA